MKKVAIIVPNWNNRELLRNCLRSLDKTNYPWYKTVVVDNGSSDGSPELVRTEFPGVDLIRLQRNEGFPKGVNAGLRFALDSYDIDYAVILNNDTLIVDGGWLLHMVTVAEKQAVIGMVNCRFLRPDGLPQLMGLRLLPGVYLDSFLGMPMIRRNQEQSDAVHETDSAGGACFLLKRSLIDAIGLLDDSYSPAYFEDVDYGCRARKVGFKLVHDGAVSVIHLGSVTRKRLPSHYMELVYRRNLIHFVEKNYDGALVPVVLILLLGFFSSAALTCAQMKSGRTALMKLAEDLRSTVLSL